MKKFGMYYLQPHLIQFILDQGEVCTVHYSDRTFTGPTSDLKNLGICDKLFPVLTSAEKVPWHLLNEHMARENHQQTLQELAQRGGLSAFEIFCNVNYLRFNKVDNSGINFEMWLTNWLANQ